MLKISPDVYSLANSGVLDDLKKALQFAVELEHSTIPPYLFARYSLGGSLTNFEILRVLREIVQEEMHHMLLAGNLLKAIGGSPIIDSPGFVPSYPTNLPGTVAADLVVPLAPFSKENVENVFMRIEQPQQILDFAIASMAAFTPSKTIGEFYGRIRDVFEAEGDGWIVDTTGATQPSHFALPPGLQKITSAADALKAIDFIVEQGEGTEAEPTFPDGDINPNNDDLAHYYKFAEMVKGRLKRNPAAGPASPPHERYIYDVSDPIPFNAAEVLPLRTNPKSRDFDPGSPARQAIDAFNLNYTKVLQQLHAAFNGQPTKILSAVDSMNRMGMLAANIVEINLDDGTRPGPTFEYAIEPVTA
jgi:hypothetical protein